MIRPLRRYFETSGRSSRSEFWTFMLFQSLIGIGLFVLWVGLVLVSPPGSMMIPSICLGIGYGLFVLGCITPNLSVTIRRLHDTGRSGWWLGLLLPGVLAITQSVSLAFREVRTTPHEMSQVMLDHFTGTVLGTSALICQLTLFVYMILPGTSAANRFGEALKSAVADVKTQMPEVENKAQDTRPVIPAERKIGRISLSNLPLKPVRQGSQPVQAPLEPLRLYRQSETPRPYKLGDKPAQPFGRRGPP